MTTRLSFLNSPNKVFFRWVSEAVLQDLDGSLTGTAGSQVVPATPTLPPTDCLQGVAGMSMGLPASVCEAKVTFHRFAFNDPAPSSLKYKNTTFTNVHGTTIVPFRMKAVTHPQGWMVLLVDGMQYDMAFVNAEQLTNVTYTGMMNDFNVSCLLYVFGLGIR